MVKFKNTTLKTQLMQTSLITILKLLNNKLHNLNKLKVKLAKAILQMLQVQKLLLRPGLPLVNLVVTTVLLTVNTLVSTNYQHHTLTVTTRQLTKNGLLTNTLQVVTVHGKMLRLTGKLMAGTKI